MANQICNNPCVMQAFEQKFPAWKNFPTGLHVLVFDEDELALADAKLKLEACNYAVTALSNKEAALTAIQDSSMAFHVSILEINSCNASEVFKIMAAAKQFPTILLSETKNVNIMMEGLAAGASEFIEKPLSEDKVKNIWQHVFRKALVTGELTIPQNLSSEKTENGPQGINNGSAKLAEISTTTRPVPVKSEPSSPSETVMPCSSPSTEHKTSASLAECEAALFLNDNPSFDDDDDVGIDNQASLKQLQLELFNDVKPDIKLPSCDSSVNEHTDLIRSPGPSTPQPRQAERSKISVHDASLSSQDCACQMKSGLEDDISTEDNGSSHQYTTKSDSEMDEFLRSNCDGEEFQSLHDLDSLEAALCDDTDMHYGSCLDFQDTLNLANDLVDELSCIDVHSSILDNLPPSDDDHKDVQITLDCNMDDGVDHNDEEALLLAEVAKAEAVMSTNASNDCKSSGSSRNNNCPLANEGLSNDRSCSAIKGADSDHSAGKAANGKSNQSKKKMKVDWTPDLHRRFVQAVEQLGVDKAIPSRILEIMGVQHLTRHNIASHLQKYRSHKKHIHAREAAVASWNQRRQPAQCQVVSRPPPPIVPVGLHVWGHPSPEQFWPKPWQASDGTIWHQAPPVCVDAWGHPAAPAAPFYQHPAPVLRVPLAPMPGAGNRIITPQLQAENVPGFFPPKDRVDAAINEVLKNPFTPLPLGLKPPSVESVLTELQKQGIKTVPFSSS